MGKERRRAQEVNNAFNDGQLLTQRLLGGSTRGTGRGMESEGAPHAEAASAMLIRRRQLHFSKKYHPSHRISVVPRKLIGSAISF